MGLTRIREDSVAALREKKTLAELQAENVRLRAEVQQLETQVTDAQVALCDVYELLVGGGV